MEVPMFNTLRSSYLFRNAHSALIKAQGGVKEMERRAIEKG